MDEETKDTTRVTTTETTETPAAAPVGKKWEDVKGSAKEEWCDLTDEDLERCAGRKEDMVDALCSRYGIDRAEARGKAEDWARRNNYLWM